LSRPLDFLALSRNQDMFFVLLARTPSKRQKIPPAAKKLIYEATKN
jgi:hypothetical protein